MRARAGSRLHARISELKLMVEGHGVAEEVVCVCCYEDGLVMMMRTRMRMLAIEILHMHDVLTCLRPTHCLKFNR